MEASRLPKQIQGYKPRGRRDAEDHKKCASSSYVKSEQTFCLCRDVNKKTMIPIRVNWSKSRFVPAVTIIYMYSGLRIDIYLSTSQWIISAILYAVQEAKKSSFLMFPFRLKHVKII